VARSWQDFPPDLQSVPLCSAKLYALRIPKKARFATKVCTDATSIASKIFVFIIVSIPILPPAIHGCLADESSQSGSWIDDAAH